MNPNPSLFDPLSEEEEAHILSPTDIYEKLLETPELLLTIPSEEEDKLRKGLASAKNKQNARLKEAGFASDGKVLTFNSYPAEAAGCTVVHVILAPRSGIRVLNMTLPDESL